MIKFIEQFQESVNGTYTFAASCQEYYDLGNRINGHYKIRPNDELHAFEVECDFSENKGSTVLKYDEWTDRGYVFPPNENQRCNTANCFLHNFNYSATNAQLEVCYFDY